MSGMKRREFITLLGGAAAAWPLAARAQRGERMRRIGVLMDVAEENPAAKGWVEAFEMQLGVAGWQKGRNLEITYRWGASDPERLARYAQELVQSGPDVLMVHGTPALIPLRQLTTTIPIVFTAVSDPVSQGFVTSVSRPGGNLTGFSNFDADIGTKWLQLLKDIVPSVKQVNVMFNPRTSPYNLLFMRSIEAAAPSFGVLASQASVHNEDDIRRAINVLEAGSDGALIVPSDPFTHDHAALIASLATTSRLPGVYAFARFAHNGGLVAYGIDLDEQLPKAGEYVARILRGAKPGELPIQAPTRFRMTINLKSAKTLNLQVPSTLLALADEVIE
jgi:putative tryptophan/tyrosine transport system substrate-binding protein